MTSHRQTGSAILILVLVLAAVASWCLVMIQSSSLTVEMALKRQEHEQVFRMTEGVMKYGIWLCKQRFLTLQKQAEAGVTAYDFQAGTWSLPPSLVEYTGRLALTVDKDQKVMNIGITAVLYDVSHNKVCTITCQLVCQHKGLEGHDQPVFFVQSWSVESNNARG